MPELPDLEVFSTNLTKALKRKKLTGLRIISTAKIDPSPNALKKAVVGKTLNSVIREGKQLRFLFSGKVIVGLHLMLHGKLVWKEKESVSHTLVEFEFGKKVLVLTDFQKAAKLSLSPAESDSPDALSPGLTLARFKSMLQSRSAIKNLLLDQQVIRGIGNAYADEILWKARIHPASIASSIPAARAGALHRAIRSVLRKAITQVRKADPGIIGGENRDFLLIHHPRKKASPGGSRILTTTSGGRKTYYTEEQVLYK